MRMGFTGFIRERENGSFRSQRYRTCKQSVQNWLERLSAAPAVNQPCEFSGEPKSTFLVDFSPDRTKIASAHGDHTVRVSDLASGKCTHILTGHPRTPWCLAFHPSHNDILASGCLGGQVRIWDLRGGGSEVFHTDSNSLIASLTFHPVDRVLVFSTKNMVYFWDWTQPEPFVCCTTSHEYERVRWVKFDTFGHYLYTGICNNTTITRPHVHEAGSSLIASSINRQHRHASARRYETLVSRFFHDPQDRSHNSSSEDRDRPTSPVHEDRLRQAFDYARFVTSHSRDNDNWISRPFRRRLGGTDGSQDRFRRRSMPSYNMFRRSGFRPQVVANSPPPRPHHDSDSDAEDSNQNPQSGDTNNHQEEANGGRSNPAVGSGRPELAGHSQERQRVLATLVRKRARREGDLWQIQGRSMPGEATSSSRLPGMRRDRSTSSPTFPHRLRLDFQDSESDSLPSTHVRGSDSTATAQDSWPDLLQPTRGRAMQTPSVGASSADNSGLAFVSQLTNTQSGGDTGTNFASSSSQQSGSETSALSGLRQGTLYNMLSGRMSCPNSAFSVIASRGSTSSHTQTASSGSSLSSSGSRCLTTVVSSSVSSPAVQSLAFRSSQPCSSTGGRDSTRVCSLRSGSGHEQDQPRPIVLSRDILSVTSLPPSSNGGDGEHYASSNNDSSSLLTSTVSTARDNDGATSNMSASCISSSLESSGSGASSTQTTAVPSTSSKRSFSVAFGTSAQPSTTSSVSAEIASTSSSSSGDAAMANTDGGYSSQSSSGSGWEGPSRHRPVRGLWNQPGRSRTGGSSSSNSTEQDGYTPGSQSCTYLHRQMNGLRGRYGSYIHHDIVRVRSLAQMVPWRCDFDCASGGYVRCPVCKTTPAARLGFGDPQARREDQRRMNMLTSHLASRMYLGQQEMDDTDIDNNPYAALLGDRTSDSTSQTFGGLNAPEHTDRGTDMVGLSQGQEDVVMTGEESEGVAESAVSSAAPSLHRVESDLERQLSENDDEISRIETSYLENMRRLAEDRQRILSTLRERGSERADSTSISAFRQPCSSSSQVSTGSAQPDSGSTPICGSTSSASSSGTPVESSNHHRASSSEPPGEGATRGPPPTLENFGPFHTLPSTSGSRRDSIEVLTGSGISETITYSELARRLANREDVMVVGNHRLASASASAQVSAHSPSSAGTVMSESGRPRGSHLLRTCLISTCVGSTRPSQVAPLHSGSSSSSASCRASDAIVPPRILVQRPSSDDQPQGTSQEPPVRSHDRRDADGRGSGIRHLHPHYSRSILDDTMNRPNDAMQSAINRAIAGVFMSSGEQAVASNIVPGTHRIQRWDFRQCQIPDLTQSKKNVVVEHSKIHNDVSIDLSRDSSLLAAFVNNHGGFPDDNILAVFSLRPESFGQCLYTKSFGPNAISVSLSPSNQYVMVGLASKRMMWLQVTDQLVGQIFRLNKVGAGEYSMMHVTDLYHPVRRQEPLVRGISPVSINSARWLPDVGEGIVYGTNHGDLHFYRAGRTKAEVEEEEGKPRKLTISTQTGTGSIRRSAFTQTADEEHTE